MKKLTLRAVDLTQDEPSAKIARMFDIDRGEETKFYIKKEELTKEADHLEHMSIGDAITTAVTTALSSVAQPAANMRGPVLMAADGTQMPLSSLPTSITNSLQQAHSSEDLPVELPEKAARRPPRPRVPKAAKGAAVPSAAGVVPAAKGKAPAARKRKASTALEQPPVAVAPALPPAAAKVPDKVGTITRPDGAARTQLRKTANLESAGNSVIVFNGDEVIILEEGSEFHLIKTGKKKGYINATYIQLQPPMAA